ncbi:MAG: NAD-dependent epimerase/dehydratase family protein [Alphaproteobacteria bacterium]|nr:NAD-dependent epimerase/dehydratase family protein [Alphaproteobacteria bacterium]
MRRYLVTGGAGFIGSHLCAALIRRGHLVRVIDDLSSGSRANLPDGVDFLGGDIRDRELAERGLDGVDGCFHLAAIASVQRGVADWVGTHSVNLTGTLTIMDTIRRLSRPDLRIGFVYASSAAVYGRTDSLPLTETSEKCPISAYGADKFACELHAGAAARVHGIRSVGLRFFNVYGPRQNPNSPYSGVISIFCDRIWRGLPIEVFGDGQQTRDFVYVDDAVDALLRAMDRCSDEPLVFNVCSGRAVSLLALIETLAQLGGRRPEIRFRPPRAGDIRHSRGAPGLARQALGLCEATPLKDGLSAVLAWLRDRRES